MWTPDSAAELERAAEAGNLEETSSFDGKRDLPASAAKNVDLAVDVAAMTTAGGTLIYGLDEDENQRLTVLAPLKDPEGAAERVDAVVQSSISEPPYVEISSLHKEDVPGSGYLVVHVPQSPRAPHQVQVKGEMRYYGRGATGNRILGEDEVARLYRQRQEYEAGAEDKLAELLSVSPHPPQDGLGYLHVVVAPVIPLTDEAWDRAVGTGSSELQGLFSEAIEAVPGESGFRTPLRELSSWKHAGAEVWELDSESEDPSSRLRLQVGMDGRGNVFWGRVAEVRNRHFVLFGRHAAATVAGLLRVMGTLYERAGYRGVVDVGVAFTGIAGAVAGESLDRGRDYPSGPPKYRAQEYRRVQRVVAAELQGDPEGIAAGLLRRLFESLGFPDYDPFTAPSG